MQRFGLSTVLLLFCACSWADLAAQAVVLDVSEDTWIHGLDDSGVSGGSADNLGICPRAGYWIYLKFDLSELDAPVRSVELRMERFDGDRPEEISVYHISDDGWSESTLSGVTRPEPRSPEPEEALAFGLDNGDHDSWSSAALTGVVRGEAREGGILTLMVREDPSDNFDVRRYFSRESSDEGTPPQLVLTLDTDEELAPGWETVDVASGVKPAFAFGPDGRLHVMGMTEEGDGVVWHASADGVFGPWSPQTIKNGYFYGPGDLVVDSQGTAHLAWHDHNEEDPNHASVDSEGTATVYRVDTPGSHNGWDNALALDSGDGLYQASVNPSAFGASTSLEYSTFDGTEWSHSEVPASGSFMYGLATSIAIDSSGRAHIVYCQAGDWTSPGDLKYAVLEKDGWHISTIVSGGARGRFPSLVVDHWDRPHVAWFDIDEDPSRAFVRYGVFNNDAWVVEDVDTLEFVELSFSGARKSVSLVLDANFRPHIAYCDRRMLKYATKPFANWELTPVLEHDLEIYQGLVELDLDLEGRPAIVFWESHPELPGLVRLVFGDAPSSPKEGFQLPGDCTQDGALGISDPICLLGNLFLGLPARLPCEGGGAQDSGNVRLFDANDDERVDLSDPVFVLAFLFLGGPAPPLGVECVSIANCPDGCQ